MRFICKRFHDHLGITLQNTLVNTNFRENSKAQAVAIASTLLGSKELGTNILELYFVMLANHDQNVLVLFRLAQSMCFYVKLESSYCRIYCVNLPESIDRSKVMQIVFSTEFPT